MAKIGRIDELHFTPFYVPRSKEVSNPRKVGSRLLTVAAGIFQQAENQVPGRFGLLGRGWKGIESVGIFCSSAQLTARLTTFKSPSFRLLQCFHQTNIAGK